MATKEKPKRKLENSLSEDKYEVWLNEHKVNNRNEKW